MARIRTIKPEMAQDEDIASCSIEAQLLAVRILNHADDEGYFKANEMLITATCFPLIGHSLNIHGMITELSNIGYLQVAKGVDGKSYGRITNFTKHQKVNRPYDSKIKDLVTFTECSLNDHGTITAGTGNREQGTGKGIDTSADKPPTCPHSEIINLYHEYLPTLPRVVESIWSESGGALDLRQRWKEKPEHQDLDFWRGFFSAVATNDWWVNPEKWGKANLRWLIKKKRFYEVVQYWANLGAAA